MELIAKEILRKRGYILKIKYFYQMMLYSFIYHTFPDDFYLNWLIHDFAYISLN